MIGKRISHYEILDKIGEGGMGEVYLARDTRLGRNVALKFVPDKIHDSEVARERLLREATAASKLNHANIVALHDIGEDEGRDFIVMEYVEGRTLREVIESGELDTDRALELARQVCRALGAAHDQDVVHRDIKADNILITLSGDAKVLDFGLAKIEGAANLTETGSTVGTAGYMSPEQVQGQAVDQRSDLFSLGVLLYEMVAGRQPFRGDHRAAVAYSIVNEEPEPLARYKSGVPEDLQRLVDKLLRKDRETRYQTAAGVLADLDELNKTTQSAIAVATAKAGSQRKWTVAGLVGVLAICVAAIVYLATIDRWRGGDGGESGRIMVAVLPFENMGPAEEEYFADGITEEITARLASIQGLAVIARTSILQYKGTQKSVQQIGDELDVDYIVEGTVRWQRGGDGPSRVRVTPQLIRVSDATHVWAHVYDEPMTAVFEVQSDIAISVTGELNVTLLEPELRSVEARPTDNLEAYDYYLRGQEYYFDRNQSEESLWHAAGLFERAVELDPEFADAWGYLSTTYGGLHWFGADRTDERLEMAKEALEKAVQLNPNSFVTRMAMGYQYYHGEYEYEKALEQFELARQLKPGRMTPHASIGYVKRRQGKWDECLAHLTRAVELDPRSPQLAYEIGETMTDLGRYEEADTYLDRSITLAPDLAETYIWKYYSYVYRGDLKQARGALEAMPYKPWYHGLLLATLQFYSRDFEMALSLPIPTGNRAVSTHLFYMPIAEAIAITYLALGEPDSSRAYFDSSRAHLEPLVAAEPRDPRFRGALGVAYAGLGRREDAIREGRRGVELMPVEKDSKQGPPRRYDLARVHLLLGDRDAAVDELEYLLSIPAAPVTVPLLRIDPFWDPLRDHPRFQKLIE